MTRSRIWTIGTAVVVVAIMLIGWFLVIAPARTEAADLKASAADTDAANRTVEAQIRQLKADQKKLPAQRAQIAEIERQLPPQPLEPALIRQLSDAADSANVDLTSITPTALAPQTGVPGVQYIKTAIIVSGDFSHLKGFLDALEENKRSVLVSGVTIGASQADAKTLQMTLDARVFVANDAATAPTTGSGVGTATNGTPTAPTAAANSAANAK